MCKCVFKPVSFLVIFVFECGTIPEGSSTLPWYTYIYEVKEMGLRGVCGGSLISHTVVLSAAHCFWRMGLAKPSDYVVDVSPSRLYRKSVQDLIYNRVLDIDIPVRYLGEQGNYQQDIALVKLAIPVAFSPTVQPVCLDFDYDFDKKQLTEHKIGTVAVWSSLVNNDSELEIHKYPYIPIRRCIEKAPPSFKEFISGDKFCAGIENRTMIFRGNSGSVLAFPEDEHGITRYYLRGVVSTARTHESEDICPPSDFVTFTQVIYYEHRIKRYL